MKTLISRIGIFRSSGAVSLWLGTVSLGLFTSPLWADDGPSVRGGLKRELYTNVFGISVQELTNSSKFPDHPDVVDVVTSFETPSQQGDNYGQRLRGYLLPPVTGSYVFYVASDDQGQLFLSTDSNPLNKQLIAWEPMWQMPRMWTDGNGGTERISPPIHLEAGQKYYVEALHKEGGGGDNFAVAWQMPGQLPPAPGDPPIAGEYLATPGTDVETGRELHAVGVYSGNFNGQPSPNHEEGQAKLVVNRPGKRVTLFLSAYEPVLWTVTVESQTILEKVILTGAYPQRITGIPLGVPVVPAWEGSYVSIGYSVGSCEFYRALPKLIALAGMPLSSFHGAYTAPIEAYVLDAVQNDPRLSPDYPQPVDLTGLPTLQFQASFFTGTSPGASGQVSTKSYTLAGVQGGGSVLPDMRVVPDSGGRYYYAAQAQEVMRIDSQTGIAEAMQVTAGEMSWPMGMAYDSLRDRVLLVTLGGEGFLYAYSPQTLQWKLVSSMNNVDLGNLVYHAAQDALYGTAQNWGQYGPWLLYRFSPEGVPQGQITLPNVCLYGAEYGVKSELVSVGDYLVMLVGQEDASYYSDPAETRMYLIDPRSGQVWLTSRQVQANQCPSVEIIAPAQNAVFRLGERILLSARATDPEGPVLTVDFFANGQKVGRGAQNSTYTFEWTSAAIGNYALTAVAVDRAWCSVTSAPVHIVVNQQQNTAPTVACPPPQSVLATTETGLLAYLTLTATVTDPDYGPLQAVWYVDGVPVATNNLPLDASKPRVAVYQGMFALGVHSVKLTVTDFIAAPVSCTTTVEVIRPGAWAYPAREDQQSPAVGSDGTNFFVVWLDRRNKGGTDWTQCDVYGARVGPRGVVLDGNGILVASNSMWASPPAVGFDGTNYLVVWQDNTYGNLSPIRGARVSPRGVVLDPNGFSISQATGLLQSDPALAFNGRIWFVAWNDWRNQSSNGGTDNLICDIYGARVTPKGEVLDQLNVPVIRAPLWQTSPAVSSLGQDFMVVWQDMDGVRGARVSEAGSVTTPFLVSQGRVGSVSMPVVAPLGTNYLAAWSESYNTGNNDIVYSWIVAARLTPEGVSLDGSGFLVRTNPGLQQNVAITRWNKQCFVGWEESDPYGANPRVWAAAINEAGQIYLVNRLTPVLSEQTQPALAANTTTLFSAWHDMRNATNGPSAGERWGDIYGAVFSFSLTPMPTTDPPDFLISSELRLRPVIEWPQPAPITYGTPLGPAQLNATCFLPGTFTYQPPAGTLLHAGLTQPLRVLFTPTDLVRYLPVTNTVYIDVLPKALTIAADNKVRPVGTPNPPLTATYTGFVAGDTPSVLDKPAVLTTTATLESPAGTYPIIVSGAADSDYALTFKNGILEVRAQAEGPGSLDLARQLRLDGWFLIDDLAKQPDGKILVAGYFRTAGDVVRTNLARLNPDGTVDASFQAPAVAWTEVLTVKLLPDGKMLVGTPGYDVWVGWPSELGLFRLNSDGSLDPNFHPGTGVDDWGGVRSIALQPDGKILIGGMFGLSGHNVLARLNADGTLDESFDAGEVYVWEGDDNVVRDLILQPDGKILVRGDIDTVQGVAVHGFCRLLPDGKLDPGWFLWADRFASAVALQPDGKVLMGGSPDQPNGMPAGLYRLNSDGTLDGSFLSEATKLIVPSALALQPDRTILLAGANLSCDAKDFQHCIHVNRLAPDGSRDSTFNDGYGADGPIGRLLLLPEHVLAAGGFTSYDAVPRTGLAWLRNAPAVPESFVRRSISGLSIQLAANPPLGTLAWAVEEMPPANWAVTDISHQGVWDRTTGKVKFGPFFDSEPRMLTYKVVPPPGFVGVALLSGTASADGVSQPVVGENRIAVTTAHPADGSLADWKLTMDEATAYAAAWKAGEGWPVPPNPIPVDYVTRASALWRGGETYKLDPSVGGPPLWWVNVTMSVVRQDGDPQSSQGDRFVAPAYVPGEPVEAVIRVCAGAAVRAYAVEERIPAGWQARALSDDGQVDAVNGFLKWGPFYDGAPRALRYSLVPPTTATGRVILAGNASFDGVGIGISGSTHLQASSRLTLARKLGQAELSLQLRGPVGACYVIERSSDLVVWTPAVTVTNQLGTVELPTLQQPASGNCYYRARPLTALGQ